MVEQDFRVYAHDLPLGGDSSSPRSLADNGGAKRGIGDAVPGAVRIAMDSASIGRSLLRGLGPQ